MPIQPESNATPLHYSTGLIIVTEMLRPEEFMTRPNIFQSRNFHPSVSFNLSDTLRQGGGIKLEILIF
jgi:hypothetical protein